MKNGIIRLNKRILITLLVMMLLLNFSGILSERISSIEEQSCWDELHRYVEDFAGEIVSKIHSD